MMTFQLKNPPTMRCPIHGGELTVSLTAKKQGKGSPIEITASCHAGCEVAINVKSAYLVYDSSTGKTAVHPVAGDKSVGGAS